MGISWAISIATLNGDRAYIEQTLTAFLFCFILFDSISVVTFKIKGTLTCDNYEYDVGVFINDFVLKVETVMHI